MTDPTPSGLPQPQTVAEARRIDAAAEALSEVLAYVKLDRLEPKVSRALSGLRAIQALSAPAVETAVQACPHADDCNLEGLCTEGCQERTSPLPVAPKAEPTSKRFSCYLERDFGKAPCDRDCGKLRCMYPSEFADSAQPVVADTLTDVDGECQYAKDVGMWPEHRCAVKCQYAVALTDEHIEAGASALVDSCITKGHWAHATEESKAIYRIHAKAVLASTPRAIPAEQAAEAISDERIDEALEAWFASGPVGADQKTDRTRMRAAIDAAMGTPAVAEPGKGEGTRVGKLERSGYFAAGGDES